MTPKPYSKAALTSAVALNTLPHIAPRAGHRASHGIKLVQPVREMPHTPASKCHAPAQRNSGIPACLQKREFRASWYATARIAWEDAILNRPTPDKPKPPKLSPAKYDWEHLEPMVLDLTRVVSRLEVELAPTFESDIDRARYERERRAAVVASMRVAA